MSCAEWAAWAEAIGTILAAMVALFIALYGERVRRGLWGPKLTVEFDAAERVLCATVRQPNGEQSYRVRLRVRNKGRSVARRCVVRVLEVLAEDRDTVAELYAVTLNWFIRHDFPSAIDLFPNDKQLVELIIASESDVAGDNPHWHLMRREPSVGPVTGEQLRHPKTREPLFKLRYPSEFGPGTYVLRIGVFSENADPQMRELRVAWDGLSFDSIKVKLI